MSFLSFFAALVSEVERTLFLTLYVTVWYPCPLAEQQKANTVKHSRVNVVNTALIYNDSCFPSTGGHKKIPEGVGVFVSERDGDKERKKCGCVLSNSQVKQRQGIFNAEWVNHPT